ncbi:MAG: hypothetical protein WCA39_06975 [Nitrososphaeraceae archaeon]
MTPYTNAENFIDLPLTDELKKEQIVSSFKKDKRTNNLLLTLNHAYKQKQIISHVYEGHKWNDTVDTLNKKLKHSGVSDTHIRLIEDSLTDNYEIVLETEQAQVNNIEEQPPKPVKIRKYTGNGTLPLHEAIVFKDGQTAFLTLDENGRAKYETEINRPGMVLRPADNLDTQNPLPYIFESPDELNQYLERARSETFGSLYLKTKLIYRKYVNIEDYLLSILSADTIYSYFQDKFPTLHYNIFVGDNGSGKNSALLVYRHLGYRVFYVVSASAPNYFTFLGDKEECQGTIAEDEAEDIGYNKEKQKIFKSGSASGGSVPKVDLTFGRTQESYLTYGMKWLAMEELPDYKKIKGIVERSFVFRFIVGDVEYNIKDVIKYAGDPKFKPLHDELIDLRKLLFAYRMIHYNDVIPDLCLNIKHRSAELTKPVLRLFSSRNDAPMALEEIRRALSKIISERNELKRNSVESKLLEIVNNLIERDGANPDGSNDLESYTFYNEDIWTETKTVMNGRDNAFKPESFYSIEFGTISHKYITSIYKSKFKAEPFKVGSGTETKRGLRFSKEVLDRLVIHYDVPDEIVILDQTDKPESKGSATDATLATHYENGDVQNGLMGNGNRNIRSSDPVPSAINVEPCAEAEAVVTRIDLIPEHEYDKDTGVACDNNDSIDRNDNKLCTEINEKGAPPSTTCVASLASVAEIGDNTETSSPVNPILDSKRINEKDVSPSSKCVASVASVADSEAITSERHIIDGQVKEAELHVLPCIWCDYKHHIEFDLGNHLLANHREQLLKLPIGKGSMDVRIDYAIQQTKREMAAQYDDEDEDAAEENDSDDVE